MIITIDGPAGAGKSSAAKALARRLGFEFLDTGAMYRAVALSCLRAQIRVDDEPRLADVLAHLKIEMPPGHVMLNGEDISTLIRTREVTALVGTLAAVPQVRRQLVQMQRSIVTGRNMVCEGRDQGTVAFPDAVCKFFLVADPTERARRRQQEMQARGDAVELNEVLRAQEDRDRRDASRDVAPMVPAADAILLDSTGLSLDEVVDRMEQEFRRRRPMP
jgi:cytidylate kinase